MGILERLFTCMHQGTIEQTLSWICLLKLSKTMAGLQEFAPIREAKMLKWLVIEG